MLCDAPLLCFDVGGGEMSEGGVTVEDVILEGEGGEMGGRRVLMRVVADATLFMSDSVLMRPCTCPREMIRRDKQSKGG